MLINNKVKIAVLVSGGGTNLQALINAEKGGIIKSGTISLVLSNKADAYALTRAAEAGIKTEVVCKKDYATAKEFEDKMISILDAEGIELYFDYLSDTGALAQLVRENSDKDDMNLVCLLLENSKAYGLSDLQAEKLIRKYRI